MELKTLKKGEVLFRAGDPGDCMYEVYTGTVGVYSHYGTSEEKLLKKYYPDEYFGEMGLIDHAPRSAAAVALDNSTTVGLITEEGFGEFFEETKRFIDGVFLKIVMLLKLFSRVIIKSAGAEFSDGTTCLIVCGSTVIHSSAPPSG